MKYTIEYVAKNGDRIREATPFDTLDDALARGRQITIDGRARIGTVRVGLAEPRCQMCGKLLDQTDDRLSMNCGGDCLECIETTEREAGQ